MLALRNPDLPLHGWLTAFREDCLGTVDWDVTLRDERDALASVVRASDAGGAMAYWTVAVFGGQGGSPDHLNLVTLHSAKGLEFRVVIMMGMEQGRIPGWNAGDITRREQRRLFYVGLSCAPKDEVHMTYPGWTQNHIGRRFMNGPSEFLAEVRDQLEGVPTAFDRAGWGCRAPLHPADWIDTPTWDPRVPLRHS